MCIWGGGAFEGETRRDVHTARVACFTAVYWRPMVCDSEKYWIASICIYMYSIDMCVLRTWTRWTINYGIVCFKVCFFQIAFGTLASLQCAWKKNIIIPASGTLHSNLMYLEEHHCKELGRRTLALQCTWKRGQGDREGELSCLSL